jgi:hypothetical protein
LFFFRRPKLQIGDRTHQDRVFKISVGVEDCSIQYFAKEVMNLGKNDILPLQIWVLFWLLTVFKEARSFSLLLDKVNIID